MTNSKKKFTAKSNVLSSDILEQQFGATAVRVLYQDRNMRVISTNTIFPRQTLELSIVKFTEEGIACFPDIHNILIRENESMGKAFRAADIEFIRDTQAVFQRTMPVNLARLYNIDGLATIVIVSIFAGPNHIKYADIFETYSPLVKWPTMDGLDTSRMYPANFIDTFDRMLTDIHTNGHSPSS